MMSAMRVPHRSVGVIVAVLTVQAAWTPVALAEERRQCPICAKAGRAESTYSEKAGSTLVRGASNALLGWTDLIRQPAREVKQGRRLAEGLIDGLSSSVVRTFGGIGEVLTFWTPKFGGHYNRFARDCPVCARRLQDTPPKTP